MNRGLSLSLVGLAAAALLAGCGGGGGSKKPSVRGVLSLNFVADPGSASYGPVGASHKITIYRTDGTTLRSAVASTATGPATVTFEDLPAGTLRLHVGLSATPTDPEIGAVDTTFQGGTAPAPMRFTMRQAVSQVAVTPTSLTLFENSVGQLYAAAKSNDGNYVYTAPGDWTWTSETPAFATVGETGTVTGKLEGGSSVKATHTVSGKSASASVGVLSNSIRRGKWTVMVFMNAANSLYQEAVDNVNQMEKVANNPNVRFVIQWKQVQGIPSTNSNPLFSGTRRYLATYDSTSLSSVNNTVRSTVVQDLGGGVDMGLGSTLGSFVAWAKGRFPADHYALVLWDHGSGWYTPQTRAIHLQTRGISLDDETHNIMTPGDVRGALSGQTVDILAYDACVMQGAEDLFEMSDKADFIVGSEENTPGPGYPYDTVFKPMVDVPDTATRDLAKNFVTAFQTRYFNDFDWKNEQLNQSVFDTSKLAPFQFALNAFAIDMAGTTGLASSIRSSLSDRRIAGGDYSFYDLDQICEKAAAARPGTPLATDAAAVRSALANMVVLNGANSAGSFMKGMSIEFGNAAQMNGSYGAGYAPLRISSLTEWDEFLHSATANQ